MFAFGSKCSFLNSADAHFDTREDDAEDVAQEAILKAFKNLARFR
jgi:DNA-directed RNA polymerase specialized sigma24 family protein